MLPRVSSMALGALLAIGVWSPGCATPRSEGIEEPDARAAEQPGAAGTEQPDAAGTEQPDAARDVPSTPEPASPPMTTPPDGTGQGGLPPPDGTGQGGLPPPDGIGQGGLPLGSACTNDASCLVGNHCVDGVCCSARRCGLCETCSHPANQNGLCQWASYAPDPDTCPGDGSICFGRGVCLAVGGRQDARETSIVYGKGLRVGPVVDVPRGALIAGVRVQIECTPDAQFQFQFAETRNQQPSVFVHHSENYSGRDFPPSPRQGSGGRFSCMIRARSRSRWPSPSKSGRAPVDSGEPEPEGPRVSSGSAIRRPFVASPTSISPFTSWSPADRARSLAGKRPDLPQGLARPMSLSPVSPDVNHRLPSSAQASAVGRSCSPGNRTSVNTPVTATR